MLQYFLQEGVEGQVNLKKMYKELNAEFFSGSLPTIILKWNGRLKRAVGQASAAYKGQTVKSNVASTFAKYMTEIPISVDVELNMQSLKIAMSKSFDLSLPDVKAVMLHEMVHIALYLKKKINGHHDTPEFDGWIKKLREQSGLNVPLKESDFKASPKLQAKEGYVMILIQKDGKYGINSYSKNFLIKNWLLFAQTIGRIVAMSAKIQRVHAFKVTHPIVSSMSPKRTVKGISWQFTDEETANEIRKKGKEFYIADKTGGTINPKVLGITVLGLGLEAGKNDIEFDNRGNILKKEIIKNALK